MMTLVRVGRAGILGVGIWMAAATRAEAIPEWARKYQTSCATCHEAFPRLTAIGESFRLNGYRLPENDDTYVRREPTSLGAPAWARVWPESIWPSDIPAFAPVAFRFTNTFVYTPWAAQSGGTARTTFSFPTSVSILTGGTLGESFSFFGEFDFGSGTPVALGFLNWTNLLSEVVGEHRLNLRIGTVGAQTIDLPGAENNQVLGELNYLKNNWALPYTGLGFASTNQFMLLQEPGMEVWGYGARYKYAFGVDNGQGNVQDTKSAKDVFAQFAYKFGGMGFDGSGAALGDKEISATPSGGWVDNSVMFGLMGYRGTAPIVDSTGAETTDRFWRLGADLTGKYGDFGAGVGSIWGYHSDPYGSLSTKAVRTREFFVEGHWFAYPWLIGSLRFETLSIDVPSGIFVNALGRNVGQDVTRIVPSVTALARANIKFILEGAFYTTNEPRTDLSPAQSRKKDDVIQMSVDWAF